MAWTDDRVQILKKLWQDGLSASQIAAELGSVTRNAVIGKIHRLGLSGRGQPTSSIKRQRRARRTVSNPRRTRRTISVGNTALQAHVDIAELPDIRPMEDIVVPISKRLSIQRLTEKTCKWPIGDPSTDNFHFCGHDSLDGKPYCEYHSRLAYQANPPRARRAASG